MINKIRSIEDGEITPLNSYKATISNQTLFYIKYNVEKENKTISEVKVFDNNLNTVQINDTIYKLFTSSSKTELDDIFLKSKEYIKYL